MDLFLKQFESEEGFKDLLENAMDLIHIAQVDGTLVYVNRSWSSVLGYGQDEIKGKSLFSFIAPADRARFQQYRQNIINGRNDGVIVMTCITSTGKEVHLEGFITAKIKGGQTAYTRGMFRDVTNRLKNEAKLKQYYEELKESEENLQQLLQYGPDAVIVIDEESRITFWNAKSEILFGWKKEEVMGASLSATIVPEKYREAHDNGMKRYLATGEAHVLNKTIEITALNKSGTEFFVSLTISQTLWKGKTSFIAFLRDITEQKENQLQLELKSKQLELSNRQLEQFAHVASHDMKEPIRKIKVFNDLVLSRYGTQLPPEAKQYLQKVNGSAERLMSMVDGVLNYSSVKSNWAPFEQVDPGAILKNIELDLELIIQRTKTNIRYRDLPLFEGVPFLIYQLFYNLINNSLKFTRSDEQPVIEITGKVVFASELPEIISLKDDVKYAVFYVMDNGIGFSQQYAEKIFQTFTRLNAKDRFEGTGLGLALCRSIVERHQGLITAYGKENKGACFKIIIPCSQHDV